MEDDRKSTLISANSNALRKAAAFLEAVASLVEVATADDRASERAPAFDPCAPTRKMPAMEQHALALDEAVRGVAAAIAKLESSQGLLQGGPEAAPLEIPLPDITTVKISRPEQMAELMAKLVPPIPTELSPGSIVEVEPVSAPTKSHDKKPETAKLGSRTGMPPGIRNPQSFGRSHRK